MICPYCGAQSTMTGGDNSQIEFLCPDCLNSTWLNFNEYKDWYSPFEEWHRHLPEQVECMNCTGGPFILDSVTEYDVEWVAGYVCLDCKAHLDLRVEKE